MRRDNGADSGAATSSMSPPLLLKILFAFVPLSLIACGLTPCSSPFKLLGQGMALVLFIVFRFKVCHGGLERLGDGSEEALVPERSQ